MKNTDIIKNRLFTIAMGVLAVMSVVAILSINTMAVDEASYREDDESEEILAEETLFENDSAIPNDTGLLLTGFQNMASGGTELRIDWWWWIILIVMTVTGEEIYLRSRKNNKDEKDLDK